METHRTVDPAGKEPADSHIKPSKGKPATAALSSLVAAADHAEAASGKPPHLHDLNQTINSDTDGSSNGRSGSSDSASSRSGGSDSVPPYHKNLMAPGDTNDGDSAGTYDDDDLSGEGNSCDGEDKDDSEGHSSSGSKINKPRWAIGKQAKFILEQVYQMERFPSAEMRRRLAKDFNVEPRQVQFWYQNRRQRDSRALRAAQIMAASGAPEAEGHGTSNAEMILHQLRVLNEARRSLGIHQQPTGPMPLSSVGSVSAIGALGNQHMLQGSAGVTTFSTQNVGAAACPVASTGSDFSAQLNGASNCSASVAQFGQQSHASVPFRWPAQMQLGMHEQQMMASLPMQQPLPQSIVSTQIPLPQQMALPGQQPPANLLQHMQIMQMQQMHQHHMQQQQQHMLQMQNQM